MLVDHATLTRILSYDAETGFFTWRDEARYNRGGKVAGGPNNKGYWRLKIGKTNYAAHRLAWFYVYGEWPKDDIDHIDENKLNNAISNLRLASASQNRGNIIAAPKNSRTGFKGVCWNKGVKKFQASIKKDNKCYYLGLFNTPEEAHVAYKDAHVRFFGDFSAYRRAA